MARGAVPLTVAPILRRDGIRWADRLLDELRREEVKLEDPAAWLADPVHAAEWQVAAERRRALHWRTVSGTRSAALTLQSEPD